MKWNILIVLLFSAFGANAELHTFILPDGRTLEAEIVGYNAKKGKVDLKRKDGKRIPVKSSIFVEADQKYIQEWAKFSMLCDPRFFKVTCKKILSEKWKKETGENVNIDDGSTEKMTVSVSKFKRYVYEVYFENRNAFPLKGLTVEYRIFYEQEESGASKPIKNEQMLEGTFAIERLRAKEKKKIKSEPVTIRTTEYSSEVTDSETGNVQEDESGELVGIWLRIYAKSSTGRILVREIFEPSRIENQYKWPKKKKNRIRC